MLVGTLEVTGAQSQGSAAAEDRAAPDRPFPADLCQAFLPRARLVAVRKGQILINEGNEACDVYLIRKGRLQIGLVSAGGREVILREMGQNCLLGELSAIDGRPRSASVTVVETGQLAQMSGEAFRTFLAEVPRAGLWVAQQLAAQVRDLTEKTFELATLPVASRVQAQLLRLVREAGADKAGADQCTLTGIPTHADLAARIGTHREAVSREMAALTQEGLIRQTGRRLDVLSLKALRALHDRMRR